jgi:RNA polymerase sigma-70 factor (ECF subfamily)
MPLVEEFFGILRTSRETVLHELLREEMQKDVQQVIGKLSSEHRMVVILRYTEGRSYEQMAEILGCSRGTVASRLNRAHKILERRLSHLRSVGGGNGA